MLRNGKGEDVIVCVWINWVCMYKVYLVCMLYDNFDGQWVEVYVIYLQMGLVLVMVDVVGIELDCDVSDNEYVDWVFDYVICNGIDIFILFDWFYVLVFCQWDFEVIGVILLLQLSVIGVVIVDFKMVIYVVVKEVGLFVLKYFQVIDFQVFCEVFEEIEVDGYEVCVKFDIGWVVDGFCVLIWYWLMFEDLFVLLCCKVYVGDYECVFFFMEFDGQKVFLFIVVFVMVEFEVSVDVLWVLIGEIVIMIVCVKGCYVCIFSMFFEIYYIVCIMVVKLDVFYLCNVQICVLDGEDVLLELNLCVLDGLFYCWKIGVNMVWEGVWFVMGKLVCEVLFDILQFFYVIDMVIEG